MSSKWTWLVERDHPWRRQLWVKGRTLTGGALASTLETERWSPEQAAHEFELEVDAVLEAIEYAHLNGALIEAEEAEDRLAAQAATGGSFAAIR